MNTGRRASDWLKAPSNTGQGEEERRSQDRRSLDRRAPRRGIDPLFAATLVNHIAPPQTEIVPGYRTAHTLTRGRVLNRWA